ncbi:MAG TPA: hypothetical protein VMT44_07885 [Methanoregula sp.]|nr:hypothetical protein [Methanoregula sp.]
MNAVYLNKWIIIFFGILSAIFIASAVTRVVVGIAGLTGLPAVLATFILYAGVFFSLIGLYERVFPGEFLWTGFG